ncbi:hypothetical protein GCM10010274_07200 [Streptomyces lavendofoliae]|uniref:Uncharacterized protein n=1 Tax=Streptomyces lavendofoliae TaxID=67314 RepID=A0A918HT80_9ACTN|nr:hypothetical protein GCM10010274_07200 [Streptomyces lavendofoliae]
MCCAANPDGIRNGVMRVPNCVAVQKGPWLGGSFFTGSSGRPREGMAGGISERDIPVSTAEWSRRCHEGTREAV